MYKAFCCCIVDSNTITKNIQKVYCEIRYITEFMFSFQNWTQREKRFLYRSFTNHFHTCPLILSNLHLIEKIHLWEILFVFSWFELFVKLPVWFFLSFYYPQQDIHKNIINLSTKKIIGFNLIYQQNSSCDLFRYTEPKQNSICLMHQGWKKII